jgi:hypothetical protein
MVYTEIRVQRLIFNEYVGLRALVTPSELK